MCILLTRYVLPEPRSSRWKIHPLAGDRCMGARILVSPRPLRLFSPLGSADPASSLDYQNRKAEYFKAIWDVINWKAAEKRFG